MPQTAPPGPAMSRTRIKTREMLVETALSMLESGWFPSVTELATATGVSRATAYRYFPSQASLVSAIVDGSLGQTLSWKPCHNTALERTQELFEFAYPRMEQHEGALRAALQVSLQQWANERTHQASNEPKYLRGHRKRLLGLATEPLAGSAPPASLERLNKALSLLFGTETLIVLKDIWGMDSDQVQEVIQWMSKVLVTATMEESAAAGETPECTNG